MFNKRNDPAESSGPMDGRREPSSPMITDTAPTASRRGAGASSVIGPSIVFQGDLAGDEDLLVEGRVEGSISLKKHVVTIGKGGRVNATVSAQTIRVEGTVEGELRGGEQVIVTRTGSVSGNIASPRVTLEDGCRFKGAIDMEGAGGAGAAGKAADVMLGGSGADAPGKKS